MAAAVAAVAAASLKAAEAYAQVTAFLPIPEKSIPAAGKRAAAAVEDGW